MIEHNKKYYEANQDQISEKHKKYYEEKRDKINQKGNCFFCNKYMMIRSLRRHYLDGHCVIKPIT